MLEPSLCQVMWEEVGEILVNGWEKGVTILECWQGGGNHTSEIGLLRAEFGKCFAELLHLHRLSGRGRDASWVASCFVFQFDESFCKVAVDRTSCPLPPGDPPLA